MLAFAWQGITSFSMEPIKWITNMGLVMTGGSFLVFLYSLYRYTEGATIVGWTSLMLSVWFIGGALLFSLGIIGEYIGKTIWKLNTDLDLLSVNLLMRINSGEV